VTRCAGTAAGGAILSGVVAALAARSALILLRARPPGGAALWSRTNHAGRSVTLLEGPAYVAGSVVGVVVTAANPYADPLALPAVVAVVCAGALGALDDLAGDSCSKGLRGHVSALREGRLTTGVVKILGLAATGLLTAVLVDRRRDGRPAASPAATVATVAAGAVVAGMANLVNLLDLRPGRALKAVLMPALVSAATGRLDATVASAGGAAVGCLSDDLAGRSMLGDTGANAAGAILGCALIGRTALRGRVASLAVLAALTLASEKVSFTRVIESTPVLRELDALGR
jgi:UDP-N-acetylmuramyl pentapeptide phosphotransferase/UDP-N-acetylglucosamine-1-phosphate transferase